MPIPIGVKPYIITDPYTGEIIFAHYLEAYGNYVREHFVPSEFVKKRGGIIRTVVSKGHRVILGFWDRMDGRHVHYAIIELLHPLDPSKKCRLREILKREGKWDELMKRGLLEDSFLIGYRKHKEIDRILKHVYETLEKERIRVAVPIAIPHRPIGLLEVLP
jgi:hypothetical protein